VGLSSEWIPIRWPCGPLDEERAKDAPAVRKALAGWLNPKALSFLEGSPVNAIVVTWAAGSPGDAGQQKALQPLLAEAKRRSIAVIGRVAGKAADVPTSGLSAIITESSIPAPGNLKIISAVKAADASSGIGAELAISDAAWPRIPAQWRTRSGERSTGAEAGPTGAPWVEANGWRCALAAAKAPGKDIWVIAEPPEDVVGYRPPHYALAVADSAAYGATWIIALDAETRSALAEGGGKDSWKAVCDAVLFFRTHKSWLEQPEVVRLGIISDFAGPNRYLGQEILNLAARRYLPYRVIDLARLTDGALNGLKSVLWVGQKAPEASAKTVLSKFVNDGGLLIAPASASALVSGTPTGSFENRFDYYAVGKGKIALATKPWSDPWLLAADTHLLLGRKHDVIRTFNAGSCNVRYASGPKGGVAQVVSYTARPFGYPATIYIAHPYRNARYFTLSGINNQPLELKVKGEGVEVYLPEFVSYAAIEFGV
jgi:hypothetical protein